MARLGHGCPRGERPRPSAARHSFSPPHQDRELSIALARDPAVQEFSRELVRGVDDHLARLAIVFTFVSHLVDIPPISDEPRDGVDVLLTLSGEASGPAVILSALLQALGENAPVRYAAGYAFVAAELSEGDLRRLPPFAAPIAKGGRLRVPLDPRSSRSPFAFLPRIAREALRVARQL